MEDLDFSECTLNELIDTYNEVNNYAISLSKELDELKKEDTNE